MFHLACQNFYSFYETVNNILYNVSVAEETSKLESFPRLQISTNHTSELSSHHAVPQFHLFSTTLSEGPTSLLQPSAFCSDSTKP